MPSQVIVSRRYVGRRWAFFCFRSFREAEGTCAMPSLSLPPPSAPSLGISAGYPDIFL